MSAAAIPKSAMRWRSRALDLEGGVANRGGAGARRGGFRRSDRTWIRTSRTACPGGIPVVDQLALVHEISITHSLVIVKTVRVVSCPSPDTMAHLLEHPRVADARAAIESSDPETLTLQSAVSAIASPTGLEAKRAAWLAGPVPRGWDSPTSDSTTRGTCTGGSGSGPVGPPWCWRRTSTRSLRPTWTSPCAVDRTGAGSKGRGFRTTRGAWPPLWCWRACWAADRCPWPGRCSSPGRWARRGRETSAACGISLAPGNSPLTP